MSTLSAGVEVDRERPAAGIGEEEFDALVVNYQRRIYRVLWGGAARPRWRRDADAGVLLAGVQEAAQLSG